MNQFENMNFALRMHQTKDIPEEYIEALDQTAKRLNIPKENIINPLKVFYEKETTLLAIGTFAEENLFYATFIPFEEKQEEKVQNWFWIHEFQMVPKHKSKSADVVEKFFKLLKETYPKHKFFGIVKSNNVIALNIYQKSGARISEKWFSDVVGPNYTKEQGWISLEM